MNLKLSKDGHAHCATYDVYGRSVISDVCCLKFTTDLTLVDILRHRKTATADVTPTSPLNTKDPLLTSQTLRAVAYLRVEKCPINGQRQISGVGGGANFHMNYVQSLLRLFSFLLVVPYYSG